MATIFTIISKIPDKRRLVKLHWWIFCNWGYNDDRIYFCCIIYRL